MVWRLDILVPQQRIFAAAAQKQRDVAEIDEVK